MMDTRDPLLDDLFSGAERDLPDKAFAAAVMTRITRAERLRLAVRLAVLAAALPLLWLVADALNEALPPVLALITRPLAPSADGLAGVLLAPLNNAAAVLTLFLLALRAAHRRFFRL